MREESERAAYAVGRWATAVRTLVLLGAPPAAAERLAAEAVSRLLELPEEEWRDPDVMFFGEVLDAWQRDRTPWWTWPAPADDPTADSGLAEIEPALDALDEPTRHHLVLVGVARLTPAQADEILGVPTGRTRIPPESLATVADAIAVAAAPLAAVRGTSRSRTRRRVVVAVVAVAVVAVLAAAAALVPVVVESLDRPPVATSTPGDAAAEGVDPPDLEPVAWYADGVLHQGGRTTVLPDVEALAALSGGVVATLDDGQLMQVISGAPLRIGVGSPGVAVVTSPAEGLLAWVDPRGPDLVVRGQGRRARVVQLPVTATTRVQSVGDGQVLLSGPARVVDLDVAEPRARPAQPGLVAASMISPDGRYLLTGSRAFGVSVVAVSTATELDLRVPGQGVVVDAAFGAPDSVTLVLALDGLPDATGFDLVTCRLSTQDCQVAAYLPGAEDQPLLAK